MNKKKKTVIGCIAGIAVLLGAVAAGSLLAEQRRADETDGETGETVQDNQYITFEGKNYEYNYNLKNILFLGVDKNDEMAEREAGRGGQSDTLILLSMNKEDETTTLLEISRDTMTEIEIYDINGEYLAKERAQITLQYAYGDGQKESCRLTEAAVSKLLYDVPISAYVAMGVDGIATVTDLMGGVKITVPEDYTYIDPAFSQGAELVLKGEQAEKYV